MLAPVPASVQHTFDWRGFWEVAAHVGTLIGLGFGGVWGYFNFVRSRTYFPRMELSISGEIRSNNGRRFLVPKITLKNIGNAKIRLIQKGTGLRSCRH